MIIYVPSDYADLIWNGDGRRWLSLLYITMQGRIKTWKVKKVEVRRL